MRAFRSGNPLQHGNFSWYFTDQRLSNSGVRIRTLALQLVVMGATSCLAMSGVTLV